MVLVVVVVVVVIVSLAGFSFVASVSTEHKAVRLQGRQSQLDLVAASGVEFLKAFFSQSWQQQVEAGGSRDNPDRFRGVLVLDDPDDAGRGRFSIVAPRVDDEQTSGIRFGAENESAKLHLGALLAWDQREPGAAHRALLNLPGMTDSAADAILDWCDADSTPRSNGAEADYYQGLGVPYAPRNGLPQCLEELLLVRGVGRTALFGADADFNHQVESKERRTAADRNQPVAAAGPNAAPWASYLTVSSAERNQSVDGTPRIHLNGDNLAALHAQLQQTFDRAKADFVVFYRQYGPYAGPAVADAPASASLDLSLPARFPIASILDLVDAKVRVAPAVAAGASPGAPPAPVV
jgi:hypothetical protein